MGRKSAKDEKSIYQVSREAANLTRREAGEKMIVVSEDRIEKIESGRSEARPEEVLAMGQCYGDPLLYNRYCTQVCILGKSSLRSFRDRDLAMITLEILHSVNLLHGELDTLRAAAQGGEPDRAKMEEIGAQLEALCASVDSMRLWLKKAMLNA